VFIYALHFASIFFVDAKDGRASYDGDAAGGAIPAPWAAPANQVPLTADLSSVAADQLLGMGGANGNSSAAQYFFKQQQQSYGQNNSSFLPGNYQLQQAPYSYRSMSGPDNGSSSFSRATSLEMLNSIAQMGSSTNSLENMGNMGDASALKQQQLMYRNQQQQQQRILHAFGGAGTGTSSSSGGGGGQRDPTADVFPGLVRGTSDNNGGSTLTFGESMGWPSFGNLNSLSGGIGGGGSMDDLLSAGLLSRQVSGGSPFDLDGPSDPSGSSGSDKYSKFLGLSAANKEGSSLGYSLEDSNSPTATTTAAMTAMTAAGAGAGADAGVFGGTSGGGRGAGAAADALSLSFSAQQQQQQQQQVRVKAPIVDMSVMRQQQQQLQQQQQQQLYSTGPVSSTGGESRSREGSSNSSSNNNNYNNHNSTNVISTNSVEQERLFDGNAVSLFCVFPRIYYSVLFHRYLALNHRTWSPVG